MRHKLAFSILILSLVWPTARTKPTSEVGNGSWCLRPMAAGEKDEDTVYFGDIIASMDDLELNRRGFVKAALAMGAKGLHAGELGSIIPEVAPAEEPAVAGFLDMIHIIIDTNHAYLVAATRETISDTLKGLRTGGLDEPTAALIRDGLERTARSYSQEIERRMWQISALTQYLNGTLPQGAVNDIFEIYGQSYRDHVGMAAWTKAGGPPADQDIDIKAQEAFTKVPSRIKAFGLIRMLQIESEGYREVLAKVIDPGLRAVASQISSRRIASMRAEKPLARPRTSTRSEGQPMPPKKIEPAQSTEGEKAEEELVIEESAVLSDGLTPRLDMSIIDDEADMFLKLDEEGKLTLDTQTPDILLPGGTEIEVEFMWERYPEANSITIVNLHRPYLEKIKGLFKNDKSRRKRMRLIHGDIRDVRLPMASYDVICTRGIDQNTFTTGSAAEKTEVLLAIASKEVSLLKRGGFIYHPYAREEYGKIGFGDIRPYYAHGLSAGILVLIPVGETEDFRTPFIRKIHAPEPLLSVWGDEAALAQI